MTDGIRAEPHRTTVATATALLAAGLWLITRPFTFAENDGHLYAFMAQAWRDPQTFGQDLFIRYGSQDAFSVFSPVYGALIAHLGLSAATVSLLLGGGALWLFGCWSLLSALLEPVKARIGLLLAASLHSHYGGFDALYLGESVLTSRIFAEAFVLLALGQLARDRWGRGALLLACAASLHPLMALGGVAVGLLSESLRRPWLLVLGGLGAIGGLALAGAGVSPFDRLFLVLDGPWLRAIEMCSGYAFLANWTLQDWVNTGAQAAAVAAAAVRTEGLARRLFIAVLATAALGLAASGIGADILQSALVVQLQLWRATWPLAWAAFPAVLILAPRSRDPALWLAPVLLGAALVAGFDASKALLAAGGLAAALSPRPLPFRIARLLLIAVAVVAFVDLTARVGEIVAVALAARTGELPEGLALQVASVRGAWLLVPLAMLAIWRRPGLALGLAVVVFLTGAATWDRRDEWRRYIMAGEPPLRTAGSVLWGARSANSWFLLDAPAYISLTQGSGLMFSRDTAIEWSRRLAVAKGVMSDKPWAPDDPLRTCAEAEPRLTLADLRRICRGPDAPAVLVERQPIPGAVAEIFETPAKETFLCTQDGALKSLGATRFYAYRCPVPAAR